jgi:hypothetical protein
MGVSDRISCLNQGRIIADGSPKETQSHPEVIAPISAREAGMLTVEGLGRGYGKVTAVRDLWITVHGPSSSY